MGVNQRFGRVAALREMNLIVEEGESLMITGPNGSGKTTLLRITSGLIRPTSGSVSVGGDPPLAVRARIGYAGHSPLLYPYLSAEENLRFFGALYGVSHETVALGLARAGLDGKTAAPCRTLSRGELQRVDLARALLHDPDLLLLDEPFTGLDTDAASKLSEVLRRGGRTLMLATHDADLGEAVTNRTVRLEEGLLV